MFISTEGSVLLSNVALQPAGQGDFYTIHANKAIVFQLYSACLGVYLKSCRVLNIQPDPGYFNGMLIRWEVAASSSSSSDPSAKEK